jgi:hypothetical protein
MVTLLAVVGYVIVVVVVVIAVLLFMLWLLSEALSRGSGRGETSPANSAREESSAVNISEYRKGYEDGRAAAREPGRDLADSLLAIVDTPDYRRGYADGLNGRNFDP